MVDKMNLNNIFKVMLGVSAVAKQASNNIIDKTHNLVEDKILKGNYVTREEFENLQQLVAKLEKERK